MSKKMLVANFIFIVVGLLLSVISFTPFCSFDGCTEAHLYKMMNMHFAVVGCAYFSSLAILLWRGVKKPIVLKVFWISVFCGLGAELMFILFQHVIIKAWCPVCLAIAACVMALAVLKLHLYLTTRERKDFMKGRFWGKVAIYGVAVIVGFLVSVAGISKPEAATVINPYLGKMDSKVEVYVFSDWFCPGCAKTEGAIEAAYPEMAAKSKILFVEKVMHPQSFNYVLFNISFLALNKDKYIPIRHALHDLAKKTTAPTQEQVQAAVAPLGVKYRPVDFVEIVKVLQLYDTVIRAEAVNSTPVLVVRNAVTKKLVVLKGSKDISVVGIRNAMKSVQE